MFIDTSSKNFNPIFLMFTQKKEILISETLFLYLEYNENGHKMFYTC